MKIGGLGDASGPGSSPSVEPEVGLDASHSIPIALRVWWTPQIPMKPFLYRVPSVEIGAALCDALARYDLFQFHNYIKSDYSNAGGLSWMHPTLTDGEWRDFDHEDEFELSEVRDAAAAQGIEARSGETSEEGSTEGESPVAGGDAP